MVEVLCVYRSAYRVRCLCWSQYRTYVLAARTESLSTAIRCVHIAVESNYNSHSRATLPKAKTSDTSGSSYSYMSTNAGKCKPECSPKFLSSWPHTQYFTGFVEHKRIFFP